MPHLTHSPEHVMSPTLIERDDSIPPLDELMSEVNRTREIAAKILSAPTKSKPNE